MLAEETKVHGTRGGIECCLDVEDVGNEVFVKTGLL